MSTRDSATDHVTAVILAGGSGERFGSNTPKQLVRVAGKSNLEHTLTIFQLHPRVDDIIVMMNPDFVAEAKVIVNDGNFTKVTKILAGGATRNETSLLALADLAPHDKVLFHDAVRPLLNSQVITDCIETLDNYNAVDVAIMSADTIIEVDENDTISAIPPRASLRRGQTPQAFRAGTLSKAYQLAAQAGPIVATDDCSIVFRFLPHEPIKVVEGADENIKITHPIDLHIADKLFQLKTSEAHSVHGNPENLRGKRVVVFGGSSGIGEAIVQEAESVGARVVSLSRSHSGTFIQDGESVRTGLAHANDELGGIDAVIVTAATLGIGDIVELDDERITELISVNLLGPAFVAQAAFHYLAESRGSLIFFTSSSYTRGRSGYSLYSAAKAGIVNLTQALADEWAPSQVRVNCINPERTNTPMRKNAFGKEDPYTLLEPEEVATKTLETLASHETGQILDVRA